MHYTTTWQNGTHVTVSTQPARAPHKRRVPLWDNARWIAITLVVVGHAILKLIADSDVAYSTYLFIYLFHVPALVTVSGYFARTGPLGVRKMKQLLTDIVFPYFIFETIWTAIHWALSGKLALDYTTASWTLWFLIALGVWRVVLPYLVLLRYPMTIAILVSVAAGYLGDLGDTLALSRTLGLLPFFVLGWRIRQSGFTATWLEMKSSVIWRWRALAIVIFAALAIVLTVDIGTWRDLLIRRFLLYDEQYDSFGYNDWWAGSIRLLMLALGMLFTLGVLSLVPRRHTWISRFGNATLYVYLLHTFVLYPVRESGMLDGHKPPWVLPAVIVGAIVLSVLLSLPWTRRWFRPLIQPKAKWLFRRKPETETGTIVLPPE